VSKFFRKICDCFFLLRIPLLVPVWTILILGWISGNKDAHFGGNWFSTYDALHQQNLWIILTGFSLIVASIYVVNQIVDIESDRINHKLFLLPHKIISVPTAWILAGLCAVSGLIIGSLNGWVTFALFASGLLLGFFYNLPPLQLKNHAIGGVVANVIGHGMLTFLVGWYSAKYGSVLNPKIIGLGLISSLSPALANGAVYLATTIPDADGDRVTGKSTFCVKYGEKRTAIAALFLCTGALVATFFIEYHYWVMAVPTLLSLVFFVIFAFSTKREAAFKIFKWPVFLLSASVSLFVPEYGVLIIITFVLSRIYYQKRFGIEYPTFKSK